jgi:WD40 repeat protein
MIVTGSWDKTVRYWDLRSPAPAGQLNFTERVYSMDVKNNMLVIATADRSIHVVKLQNPTKIYKSPACALNNQLRDVSCFTDGMGCTVGEIGGRVQCLWTDEPPNSCVFSRFPKPVTQSDALPTDPQRTTPSNVTATKKTQPMSRSTPSTLSLSTLGTTCSVPRARMEQFHSGTEIRNID